MTGELFFAAASRQALAVEELGITRRVRYVRNGEKIRY
jgi:hypothetical protein